jgi:hypothetical protein
MDGTRPAPLSHRAGALSLATQAASDALRAGSHGDNVHHSPSSPQADTAVAENGGARPPAVRARIFAAESRSDGAQQVGSRNRSGQRHALVGRGSTLHGTPQHRRPVHVTVPQSFLGYARSGRTDDMRKPSWLLGRGTRFAEPEYPPDVLQRHLGVGVQAFRRRLSDRVEDLAHEAMRAGDVETARDLAVLLTRMVGRDWPGRQRRSAADTAARLQAELNAYGQRP